MFNKNFNPDVGRGHLVRDGRGPRSPVSANPYLDTVFLALSQIKLQSYLQTPTHRLEENCPFGQPYSNYTNTWLFSDA